MLNWIKRLALALIAWWAPQAAPLVVPAASGTVAAVTAPAVSTAALAGATAIVAAIAEDGEAAQIHALNWGLDDGAANSDIRLIWDSSNLLSRTEHTAIWRYNPHQQDGYYTVAWHSPNDGSWDGGVYSLGTHPYPASDCLTTTGGAQVHATGGGPDHCWEIAGAGSADDWLLPASQAGGTGYTVVKNKWYTQVRRSHLATSGECNGSYEDLYIPDYDNNPTQIVRHCQSTPTGAGSTPAFYFGGSDWTVSGSANSETLAGKLRGIQLYGAALSDADIATEVANTTSNTPTTSAGIANVWYMNQDPIPSDVTDKSGAGHNPSWANANRPTQWDSTVASASAASGILLRGGGR